MAPRKYELGKRAATVEETRRRIIDATFELHSEKGVLATSMQDVAERADVALRTVYNHYPTIDHLVAGCSRKVISILSPPTPEIFADLDTFEERMRRLIEQLFAMYERGSAMIEVARCERSEVAGLADFVANEAAIREGLVREALRPFKPRSRLVREVAALTDFYVWKAFVEQNLTTRQAADVVHRSLAAQVSPDVLGEKGQNDDDGRSPTARGQETHGFLQSRERHRGHNLELSDPGTRARADQRVRNKGGRAHPG